MRNNFNRDPGAHLADLQIKYYNARNGKMPCADKKFNTPAQKNISGDSNLSETTEQSSIKAQIKPKIPKL